jgi:hypothetical protein
MSMSRIYILKNKIKRYVRPAKLNIIRWDIVYVVMFYLTSERSIWVLKHVS